MVAAKSGFDDSTLNCHKRSKIKRAKLGLRDAQVGRGETVVFTLGLYTISKGAGDS